MDDSLVSLLAHQAVLHDCRDCPDMTGPPVTGQAVMSPVMLIGQAPGPREIETGRPFAWTSGRTLFGWFAGLGLTEQEFRSRVYMSAVCRCFPGKNPKGGDRVPSRHEVGCCGHWLQGDLDLLAPRLVIPVGRLAIARFFDARRLVDVIGSQGHWETARGRCVDVIPLPHPSGVSSWFKTEPGRTLLARALGLIGAHPVWQDVVQGQARGMPKSHHSPPA